MPEEEIAPSPAQMPPEKWSAGGKCTVPTSPAELKARQAQWAPAPEARQKRPERPHNGWEAIKPHGFWDWFGLIFAILIGIAVPLLGLMFLVAALWIVGRSDNRGAEEARKRQRDAAWAELRFCGACKQNVKPDAVPSATAPGTCPICKGSYLGKPKDTAKFFVGGGIG